MENNIYSAHNVFVIWEITILLLKLMLWMEGGGQNLWCSMEGGGQIALALNGGGGQNLCFYGGGRKSL